MSNGSTNSCRIILVTGANKGIGKEIVRQLAQPGDVVLLGSRDMEKGESAVKDLQATGGRFDRFCSM